MPPRKSDVSLVDADTTTMTDAGAADADTSRMTTKDAVAIEDLNLPKSILTRLAKGVLPPNTQIQGNAMVAISKSATVFISYLASHANENTMDANKKTIAPADVFKALEDTEFAFLREPLEAEFNKFNTIQTEKRNNYRAKVKASRDPADPDADTDMADTSTADAPPAKKARVVGEAGAADDTEVDDDAQIDEETHVDDDDDDDEEQEDEEDEDEDEDPDATQDALEEKPHDEGDVDEALDGDESD